MGDRRLWSPTSACLLLLTVIPREAFATGLGKCPDRPKSGFNMKKMDGTWYEVERTFNMMELAASCTEIELDYNKKSKYRREHLLITVTTKNRWTGVTSVTKGVGILSYWKASSFRFRQTHWMPFPTGKLLPGTGPYHILAADYDTYAVVWSCTNLCFAHTDRFWILGRSRTISALDRAQIYAKLELDLKLDPDRLMLSRNTYCGKERPHKKSFFQKLF